MFFRILIGVIVFFSTLLSFQTSVFSADLLGASALEGPSVGVSSPTGTDPIETFRQFGFKILSIAKLLISGVALIYLVLIGAYMVVFSENEERIKTQRKQVSYALIGFLFLNIPGVLYQVFFGTPKSGISVTETGVDFGDFSKVLFWDLTAMNSTIANLIAFFQVFIFGAAILTFTWGLFKLVLSAGDEERVKTAKNRILYGTLGLLFLGFVKVWGSVVAKGDFSQSAFSLSTIVGKIMGLGLYFVPPVAILFLIVGSYYYITSGGDEERVKKGKNIIVNTFIAIIILLASYSFLLDIAKL